MRITRALRLNAMQWLCLLLLTLVTVLLFSSSTGTTGTVTTASGCSLCEKYVELKRQMLKQAQETNSTPQKETHRNKPLITLHQDIVIKLEDTLKTRVPDKFNPSWWKNHTRTMCDALKMNTSVSRLKVTGFDGNVIIDDKHKTIHCQIAKVASSYLGKLFAIVTGVVNETDPEAISSNSIHTSLNARQTHFFNIPFQDFVDKLKTHYTFLLVREPFERLLSAYKNKLVNPPAPFQYLSSKIIRTFRSNASYTGGVTFTEFVRYLTDPHKSVMRNVHWQPYHELCHPCEVNYDFVAKLETLHEDIWHIFSVNNLTSLVKLPHPGNLTQSLHRTDLLLGEYYSQLPKDLLKKLYDFYYPDFAIFNYTVPAVIKNMMT